MFEFEKNLVEKFIEIKDIESSCIRECDFRWGNIDVVEYRTRSINSLTEKQRKLLKSKENLLLFSNMYKKRPHTAKFLAKKLNTDYSTIVKKLQLFIESDIAICKNNTYEINESIDFPDVTVVSYEMKLNKIKKAINQAVINKKYSDYSYVVMPLEKYNLCMQYKEIIQKCSIGLILVDNNTLKEVIRPQRNKVMDIDKLIAKISLSDKIEYQI